jgi:hypothetical protein
MMGKGIFVYANGNKYIGDFLDDAKDGTGTLTCPNGEKYEVFSSKSTFDLLISILGSMEE